jgi:hypothetical protein
MHLSHLFCCEHDLLEFLLFSVWWYHVQASGLVVAVDDDGCFIEKISDFKGRHVKEADKDIISAVKVSRFSSVQWALSCKEHIAI